jgi:hypothetical protein
MPNLVRIKINYGLEDHFIIKFTIQQDFSVNTAEAGRVNYSRNDQIIFIEDQG